MNFTLNKVALIELSLANLFTRVDEKTRGAVVRIADKGKSSYLQRPLQRLFPFEILDDVKKEPESVTEDVASVKEGNPEPV